MLDSIIRFSSKDEGLDSRTPPKAGGRKATDAAADTEDTRSAASMARRMFRFLTCSSVASDGQRSGENFESDARVPPPKVS